MENGKGNKFNENEIRLGFETLQTNIEDVRNIVQLLEISLTENKEDKHIIRSVNVIDKMLKSILVEDMNTLKELLLHQSEG